MSTNDPMTQEQLDEIKARADSVTTLRRARRLPALRLSDDASTLIAEVERLRALTTVTEGMVERGVRAFYEHQFGFRTDWDRLTKASPDVADNYRRHMTAALNAALGTGRGDERLHDSPALRCGR